MTLLSLSQPWQDPLRSLLFDASPPRFHEDLRQVIAALKRKSFPYAFELTQRLLRDDQVLASSLYCAGLSALGIMERVIAERYFTRVLFSPHLNRYAAQHIMELLYAGRRFPEMIALGETRIRMGGSSEDYFMLGIARRASGQAKWARRELTTAVEFSAPDHPNYFVFNLALAQSEFSAGLPDRALMRLDQIKSQGKRDVRKWLLSAQCYARIDEKGQALKHLKRALRLSPQYPDAHALMGDLLADNNPKRALKSYRYALEAHVYSPQLLLKIVRTAERLGRLKEAISALEHYLSIEGIDHQVGPELLQSLKISEVKRQERQSWLERLYENWR